MARANRQNCDKVPFDPETAPMKRCMAGVIVCALALSACATQPTPSAYDPPGFLWGFVHGFISLFSLIGSFFWDIRVYAFPNGGRWYDVGFVLGASCFFGGIGLINHTCLAMPMARLPQDHKAKHQAEILPNRSG
jgi:hypothetical protein